MHGPGSEELERQHLEGTLEDLRALVGSTIRSHAPLDGQQEQRVAFPRVASLPRLKKRSVGQRAAHYREGPPLAEDSDGFSSPSQLLEDLLRLLGIVGHYRELDETIGDACHIDRFEVDAGVAQPARNVGDDSG